MCLIQCWHFIHFVHRLELLDPIRLEYLLRRYSFPSLVFETCLQQLEEPSLNLCIQLLSVTGH